MKNKYSLLLSLIFSVAFFIKGSATTHVVLVTDTGFSPFVFFAVPGDTVKWEWVSGNHTTTSISGPSGATGWNSPINSTLTTFSYAITTVGTYAYTCFLHSSELGAFIVDPPSGLSEQNSSFASEAYPNPFREKFTLNYKNSNSLDLYNIAGGLVKSIALSPLKNTIELDLSDLPAGTYMYALKNEGILTETRKIVKLQ